MCESLVNDIIQANEYASGTAAAAVRELIAHIYSWSCTQRKKLHFGETRPLHSAHSGPITSPTIFWQHAFVPQSQLTSGKLPLYQGAIHNCIWPSEALATATQVQISRQPLQSSRCTGWYMNIASHSQWTYKQVPSTYDDKMLMPVLSVNMALLSAFSSALLPCRECVLEHPDDVARMFSTHRTSVAACDGCALPTWHQSTPPRFKCKNSSRSCCTMASMWVNE